MPPGTRDFLTPEEKADSLLIEIPLDHPLSGPEQELVGEIGRTSGKNGFSFEFDEENLRFYLRSLDTGAFRSTVLDLLRSDGEERGASPRMQRVFGDLLDRIDSVRSYGIRGKKRIYATYNRERKVEGRHRKEKARGSWYYALDHGFEREENALPEEFRNAVIAGDSEEVLRRLPPNCIDLVVTSPPYNFGLGYDTGEDGVDWERYFSKLFSVFDECIRVLKFGGRIIVNIQPLFSDYIPSHHVISHYFMKKKLIWKGEILWEKHNYNCKYTAWGSWKSPGNPYLKYTWEFLEVFAKGDLKKEGSREKADITADEFKKWVVAKWSIAPERQMARFDHPAMFPEELVMRALKLFSFEGDVVLDPFNGAGTTCVAAKKLNRSYLGIDISQKYCETAERRLKEIL
ncbi:MAG: Modification methylase MjaV [Methanoregulaceae archaeon PtaB.Bin056]|jgi:DNA modification methylase|nr:MAG: Modification methylase MjaV [Methanoregulaceae archaeon PtaB.Bin056]